RPRRADTHDGFRRSTLSSSASWRRADYPIFVTHSLLAPSNRPPFALGSTVFGVIQGRSLADGQRLRPSPRTVALGRWCRVVGGVADCLRPRPRPAVATVGRAAMGGGAPPRHAGEQRTAHVLVATPVGGDCIGADAR